METKYLIKTYWFINVYNCRNGKKVIFNVYDNLLNMYSYKFYIHLQ